MLILPENFRKNVINTNGTVGSKWLNILSDLINNYSKKWQLSKIKIFENISYNFVALAYSAKYEKDVVLKISIPGPEFFFEQNILIFWNGQGCVKLLDFDSSDGVMLLAAIEPGISLKNLFPVHDNEATLNAISVIKEIHSKSQIKNNKFLSDFPTTADWLDPLYFFNNEKIPKKLLQDARDLSKSLLSSHGDLYLLHGDLHHENILLDSNNTWLAIDPKGVVGELAFECGAFIRNPMPQLLNSPHLDKLLSNRFDQFSKELDIDRQRLVDWCFVQSILAAIWAIEDESDMWTAWLECAKLINIK